ncbi:CheW domain-containing protein [Aurantiacibacter sp. D1-12]|uniref:CheW domain-containing protein n=1 Tax=Aurantiacibacter sp. D1-12 TaxID=2993658 RepID=UPI00237CFFA0|nr:CheW domain-containing protein [Aurantiacibacter sp. D1-12]MDE1466188.1 CheW domain-containing protein [Aurantiacibacter sp. D1-12]
MNEPILLAQLAGRQVAFPARQIDSIIELGLITPVPRSPHYVEGLSTLRSKSLTVINCKSVLGIDEEHAEPGDIRQAAVVKHGSHHYALLLDDVHDVVETKADPQDVLGGVGEEWARVASGVVETSAGPALLMSVVPFIEVETEFA